MIDFDTFFRKISTIDKKLSVGFYLTSILQENGQIEVIATSRYNIVKRTVYLSYNTFNGLDNICLALLRQLLCEMEQAYALFGDKKVNKHMDTLDKNIKRIKNETMLY